MTTERLQTLFIFLVGFAVASFFWTLGYLLANDDDDSIEPFPPKEYELNERVRGIEYMSPSGQICNWVYQSPSGAGGLSCLNKET